MRYPKYFYPQTNVYASELPQREQDNIRKAVGKAEQRKAANSFLPMWKLPEWIQARTIDGVCSAVD
jgi:hypothetical protein